MKKLFTKISLILLTGGFILSCDAVKRVPEGKQLLVENKILVNEKRAKSTEINDLLIQRPNSKVLGVPLSLHIYNIAKPNPDSIFKERFIDDTLRFKRMSWLLSEKQVYRLGESFWYSGIHTFLKNTGETPTIINENRSQRTIENFKRYYFNNGYFNVQASYTIDSVSPKRARATYEITPGTPYILDSITEIISSPEIEKLYNVTRSLSRIKKGEQYKSANFDEERSRLTNYFRNNGAYFFQQNYITFSIDTVDTQKKANVVMNIDDHTYRIGETIHKKPFKLYTISEVNIFVDDPASKNPDKVADSIHYNGFTIYSPDKIKFKPKALTNPVFITPGSTYADFRTNLTSRFLSNLRTFKYPSIQYKEDPRDTTGHSLIANISLSQLEKYQFGASVDFLHSNIQDFGIAGSLNFTIRNLFRGAERLELSTRGNIGSSRELANPNDVFFNLSEYGADAKLFFPKVLFPVNTERIIPKNMIPETSISTGFAKQQNIGLDKENLTGVMSYSWIPKRFNTAKFDLFNVQYVKNVNTGNYFRVYRSSYANLNEIAQDFNTDPAFSDYFNQEGDLIIEEGTQGFINDVLDLNSPITESDPRYRTIRSIEERRRRLTENNLILASSYSYSRTNRSGTTDNSFYVIRTKIESAGNFIDLIARTTDQPLNTNGNRTFLDIEYSQYIKSEVEFIKHWDFRRDNVLAMRTFFGIAIPYGNSNNIPFSRSYFGGGSNDNRAWQPYSLGPGRSGGLNDFNEANMKIAFNLEYRFTLSGDLKGALFADIGNIWNVLDNIEDPDFVFTGARSFTDLAGGSGFGFRYDFSFFVVRLDLGFKTYNPANPINKRWFNEYNFSNSVLNIGINYPF